LSSDIIQNVRTAEVIFVFKRFQEESFTLTAIVFVLEMGLPISVGKSILPEEEHR